MSRTIVGTRFTTGCGHSWKRRYPKWRILDMRGATSDCAVCGELVIIPREQFGNRKDLDAYPASVHMPLFHRWMNEVAPWWPADGGGTGYIEFSAN